MIAAAVVAAVGVGIQVYSDIKQGDAQADAARIKAQSDEAQAQEVEYRAGRNANLISEEGSQVMGEQAGAFAVGGVELSGSALLTLQGTQARMNQDIYQTYHEARFRASQLRIGEGVDNTMADNYQTAGYLNAGAAALKTGGMFAMAGSGGGGSTILGSPSPMASGVGTNGGSYAGLV